MIGYSTATLFDLDGHYKLHVHCSEDMRHHNKPMNITALRRRLSDDFPTCDLASRLRCNRCGSRKVLIIITPFNSGQSDSVFKEPTS